MFPNNYCNIVSFSFLLCLSADIFPLLGLNWYMCLYTYVCGCVCVRASVQFTSVQLLSHVWFFECHELHARPPCPSPTPRVHSNSRPSSRWCHPAIWMITKPSAWSATKIMASGPITSWQIDGETVETVTDSILGGSKITADGDCSH